MNNNIWVYDIETIKSCFTYTGFNINTKEIIQFVLHKERFELDQLLAHLKQCEGQIGFNNINFDYPIIHYLLNISDDFGTYNLNSKDQRQEFITLLYKEAQRIIEAQNMDSFHLSVVIRAKAVKIQQLDLFRLWHYNNKARSTSLKSLEISMNYPNVMDLPLDHTNDNVQFEEIQEILDYNLNDVLATYEFYLKSNDKINLRKSLTKQYDIPCRNYSDSKIGESLMLKLYCDETGQDTWKTKDLRSNRSQIDLKECLLPSLKFNSKQFNNLLDSFKGKIITQTKGAIATSVVYKGFKYDYGTGGIHGCIKPGIYEDNKEYSIIDLDVSSLYPSLAIVNNFYPEHLGPIFNQVYKGIIDLRLKAKKEGNSVLSDGFKLAANSVYGKSNDINSFLYDPKFTMCITLNGQLQLTMLAERLVDNIPNLTMIQVNTDGITVKIPKQYEDLYYEICKTWEIETKLGLEYVYYSKMVVADVNNYLSVKPDGKCKYKGRFEIDKVVGSEPAYHKDNSFKIVPIALSNYFVKGIPIEETIRNHSNIYDFCGRQKFKRDSYGQIHYLDNDKEVIEKQQKNTRYYISNKGSTFMKQYYKGTSERINDGFLVTIFNKFVEKEDYDINYSFYVRECQKEITLIQNKQLQLI